MGFFRRSRAVEAVPNVYVSKERGPGLVERSMLWLLSHGSQPRHVSVVLDSAAEDHVHSLSGEALVARDLGIVSRIITVAANLGTREFTAQILQKFPPRNRDDMGAIYQALKESLRACLEYAVDLDRLGIRLRTFGDASRLPEDIQRLIARVEMRTASNTRLTGNLTLGDSTKHEVAQTVSDISKALVERRLRAEDLTHEFIDSSLSKSMPSSPDVIIKTSEVNNLYKMLSSYLPIDFLSSSFAYNLFLKSHVPDFAFWVYVKAVLEYQTNESFLMRTRQIREEELQAPKYMTILSEGRRREFHRTREICRRSSLYQMVAIDRPLLSIEETSPDKKPITSPPSPTKFLCGYPG